MRAVIQRVLNAGVEVNGQPVSRIETGLLVYVSVGKGDTDRDAQYLADKLANLRIFPDEAGKMNRSIRDIGAQILLVSNFTLHGNCQKGRRPGFDAAAEPTVAKQLYENLIQLITRQGISVESGIFAEHMHVASLNDGPVTFLLDSEPG